jgi:ribosomal protein L11 methyltransferase
MSRRHAQNLETVWLDSLPEEAVPAVEAALERVCR